MKKVRYKLLIFLAPALLCPAFKPASAAVDRDFSYYQIILDKKPFGEVIPPEAAQPQATLNEMILKEWEMKAIVDDGSGTRIGLLDKKNNKTIYLSVGESHEGLQVVSVNYENEEAVLKRGDETATIKLRPDKDKPPASLQAPPHPAAPPMQMLTPSAFTNSPSARKPFFADLRRRASPFRPAGTNVLPFQSKPLDSFFKVSTGAFPHAQSPFGPFQAPPGNTKPDAFQQFIRPVSNMPNPFMPVQDTGPQAEGSGMNAEQLLQNQPQQDPVQPATPEIPVEINAYEEDTAQ